MKDEYLCPQCKIGKVPEIGEECPFCFLNGDQAERLIHLDNV